MPKVSESYFENKKHEILDVTYRVCMSKPMHEVSMRDIIAESGWSQGRIYRYFSNIDDILIELINSRSVYYDVENDAADIISNGTCPEVIISELFMLWKRAFLDHLVGVGKIYYELCSLYVNDRERFAHFISKCVLPSREKSFQEISFSYVVQKVADGYFAPKLPIEMIIQFLITSLDGIIRDLILCQYNSLQDEFPLIAELNGVALMHSCCTSFILLLGGNEALIKREVFSK